MEIKEAAGVDVEAAVAEAVASATASPADAARASTKFSIGGHEGYITAGKYEDGSIEIFRPTSPSKARPCAA